MLVPSEENVNEFTGPWGVAAIRCPVTGFQSLAVRSQEPVAISDPSGLNAIALTAD